MEINHKKIPPYRQHNKNKRIFLQKKHNAHERILRKTNCLKKIDKNSKKMKNAIDQTISMMYSFFIN